MGFHDIGASKITTEGNEWRRLANMFLLHFELHVYSPVVLTYIYLNISSGQHCEALLGYIFHKLLCTIIPEFAQNYNLVHSVVYYCWHSSTDWDSGEPILFLDKKVLNALSHWWWDIYLERKHREWNILSSLAGLILGLRLANERRR